MRDPCRRPLGLGITEFEIIIKNQHFLKGKCFFFPGLIFEALLGSFAKEGEDLVSKRFVCSENTLFCKDK